MLVDVISGVFQLEEFFSVDDVFDDSDRQGEIKTAAGSTFNYVEGIEAGQSFTLANLQG